VRELVRGRAERDHDRQVVEELERRGRAMLLAGVAPCEPAPAVDLYRADRASLREHLSNRPTQRARRGRRQAARQAQDQQDRALGVQLERVRRTSQRAALEDLQRRRILVEALFIVVGLWWEELRGRFRRRPAGERSGE